MDNIETILKRIKSYLLIDRIPDSEIARINIQRLTIYFYILFAVHLLHVVFFWLELANGNAHTTESVYQWRIGIIIAQGITAVLVLAAAIFIYYIRKKGLLQSKAAIYLPGMAALAYLIHGVVICLIDQLVTSAITPYFIASIAVALGIILKPQVSLTIYPLAYLLFYLLIPITQTDREILMSVRANGFTATSVGLALSIIIWRTNLVTMIQSKLIERQKEELEKKNTRLEQMVRTDMLTGLYNRMRFTEFVEMEAARIKRTGENSTLIFMDLDHFKEVNDSYGHPSGDTVLKWIAGVIKGQLRSTDILARFGGEEFAILLPDTSVEGACKVAEKIRSAIENCTFPGKMENLKMTASFGVAPLNTDEIDNFHRTYKKADAALYRAKQGGRNRVEFVD